MTTTSTRYGTYVPHLMISTGFQKSIPKDSISEVRKSICIDQLQKVVIVYWKFAKQLNMTSRRLKGIVPQFFLSLKSLIFDSNGDGQTPRPTFSSFDSL